LSKLGITPFDLGTYTVCFIKNENRFMDYISTATVLIILKFTGKGQRIAF